jgi:hypothetical protein
MSTAEEGGSALSSIRLTAEVSYYRSPHRYVRSAALPFSGAPTAVRPAENFVCDGPVCTCDGLPDCTDMFGTDLCGPVALCDSTSGLVCGCIRK